jgi:hypothetical protein
MVFCDFRDRLFNTASANADLHKRGWEEVLALGCDLKRSWTPSFKTLSSPIVIPPSHPLAAPARFHGAEDRRALQGDRPGMATAPTKLSRILTGHLKRSCPPRKIN